MHEQLPETGYAHNESPKISVDSPPAIGNEYHIAKFEPVLNNTGFITSIDVVESGSGYISPPDVTIVDKGGKGRGAEACAVLGTYIGQKHAARPAAYDFMIIF